MGSRFWLGTIFRDEPITELPPGACWTKGQLELCPTTGRKHLQLVIGFSKPQRLAAVKKLLGEGHYEPSRSIKADEYCHKDATSIPGTRFEFGTKALRRNVANDWQAIKDMAQSNRLDDIPPDIYIRYYSSLTRIALDHLQPIAIERTCHVFWGATGTGKSLRAWTEAGQGAFSKDPRTKWWCGYRSQTNIVIDEFRGTVDVSHLLRWLDRYPVIVEIKGGARPLAATTFWITSNLDPRKWYPEIDDETLNALLRRLNITHFN